MEDFQEQKVCFLGIPTRAELSRLALRRTLGPDPLGLRANPSFELHSYGFSAGFQYIHEPLLCIWLGRAETGKFPSAVWLSRFFLFSQVIRVHEIFGRFCSASSWHGSARRDEG